MRDWWAARSKQALKRRIDLLERQLQDVQKLPLLTEEQDGVLRGFQGVYRSVALAVHLVIGGFLIPVTIFSNALNHILDAGKVALVEYCYLGLAVENALPVFKLIVARLRGAVVLHAGRALLVERSYGYFEGKVEPFKTF
jgi:hypothetical protein